jgi:hypothetical protein
MATFTKAFTKNSEDDWSGIVRSRDIPETDEAASLAKANVDTIRSLNAVTTRGPVSNNEYHIVYSFPTVDDLVAFVNSYHNRNELKVWTQKRQQITTQNQLPVYRKKIIIKDNDGNEISQETLFANTEILKRI